MTPEVFAQWMSKQGYSVIKTQSGYWCDLGHRVLQSIPYHRTISPSDGELKALLVGHKAIALRYSTPQTVGDGMPSYHVICDDPGYDIGNLKRQTRQNIKRGLSCCRIEQIEFSMLADEGWQLRKETLARQGRIAAENRDWWQKLCSAAGELEGFEAWGAISDGRLVASFLAFNCGGCYLLPYEQSATAYIHRRVNNALFYYVTHNALRRSGITSVFFGLQSLDAPASVDEFKFRMGFTAWPVRQRVVFHPLVVPFANSLSHRVIGWINRRHQGNYLFSKAEGMLRFYLEGNSRQALRRAGAVCP